MDDISSSFVWHVICFRNIWWRWQRLTLACREPSLQQQILPWRKGYWQEWRETPEKAVPPAQPCSLVSAEKDSKRDNLITTTAITTCNCHKWTGSYIVLFSFSWLLKKLVETHCIHSLVTKATLQCPPTTICLDQLDMIILRVLLRAKGKGLKSLARLNVFMWCCFMLVQEVHSSGPSTLDSH